MKKIIYLGYYFLNSKWAKIIEYAKYVKKEKKKSYLSQYIEILYSSMRYDISFIDYYYYKFYERTPLQKNNYAGTGFMYEFQKKQNQGSLRKYLSDKFLFAQKYNEFISIKNYSAEEVLGSQSICDKLISNNTKLVLKPRYGAEGNGIVFLATKDFTTETLRSAVRDYNSGVVEEFVDQHPAINKLSPYATNTLRVITQVTPDNEVDILLVCFRISNGAPVDNFDQGGISAIVNIKTGVIDTPGIFKDPRNNDLLYQHPLTGEDIVGFEIPYWTETVEFVKRISLHIPQLRSVGWDIAITANGPTVIEGNDNWWSGMPQITLDCGIKDLLLKYK